MDILVQLISLKVAAEKSMRLSARAKDYEWEAAYKGQSFAYGIAIKLIRDNNERLKKKHE
jgi:hypothetical protein